MHERSRAGEAALLQEQAPGGRPVQAPRTNWHAIGLTLLMPLVVTAGFVWLALRPEWNDTGEWAFGMLLLLPFEFVRVIVFWILRDAYKDSRSALQALRFFLLSLLILAAMALVFSVFEFGFRETYTALRDPQTWRIIVPPMALIVVDGVIGLLTFRGDPRCEAARLDAQGDDAQDWFTLALYAAPFVLLLPCFVLFVVMQEHDSLPEWMPRGGDGARALCMLFIALYFFGKGLILAQVHGARFMSTGQRVLANPAVQFLLERDGEKRRKNAKEESEKAAARRAVFVGDASAEASAA